MKGQSRTCSSKKSLAQREPAPALTDGDPRTRENAVPRKSWRELFAIDPRSLAVFRMALGCVLLVDLASRLQDLNVMYTDGGMFSRVEICRRVLSIWNWSVHYGSGSASYMACLSALAAGLGVAFVVGFQTRVAAVGSWLMLISIHHRVPPILSGADLLLRMLLFWGMLLPLGRVWSMDARLLRKKGKPSAGAVEPVLSVACAGLLMQMALMYFFSAIFKSNPVWFRGEAIAGSLAHAFYASPMAAWFLQFPRMLKTATWATLLLEYAGPLLLFCPWWTARIRMGVVAAMMMLHVGIGFLLEVDLFSPVAIAGLIPFLPREFWEGRGLSRILPPRPAAAPAATDRNPRGRGPEKFAWAMEGVCFIALVYVLALNLNSLPSHPLGPTGPETWKPLAMACGLAQKWNMFEDVPSKSGWYVARATLRDGSEVDLLRQGAPLDWTKPKFPAGIYPDFRWRKIFREIAYEDELGYQFFRQPVAEYLCRNWNVHHPGPKSIREFDLIFCMQKEIAGVDLKGVRTTSREKLAHLAFGDPAS